jgi:hypothetical protein
VLWCEFSQQLEIFLPQPCKKKGNACDIPNRSRDAGHKA